MVLHRPIETAAFIRRVDCFHVARDSATEVVLVPILGLNLATKIRLDFGPACMSRPIGWRSAP